MSDNTKSTSRVVRSKTGREEVLITENNNGQLMHSLSGKVEVRDVVGYEDRFMVSEAGDLISKKTNKILSQTPDDNGYLTHATKIGGRNGEDVLLRMHRVVAEAFIPNPENKSDVNHDNGIKSDNVKSNLEWATSSQNSIHAFQTGLRKFPSGHNNRFCKLDDDTVNKIRQEQGKISSRAAGEQFGVSAPTITRIWNKETYNHIPEIDPT